MMRANLVLALLLVTPAFAQEPAGCDKFKWPVDNERALLARAAPIDNGATISQSAAKIKLMPGDTAQLPHPPSRQSKAGAFAGFVNAPAPEKAGVYRITLSAGGWIDVFQDGKEVKSTAFSGVTGCDGIRKSVKFSLTAEPYVIEISGVAADSISVVVTAD